jgi:hypothetical protein
MEIKPNTENAINIIHILGMDKTQYQWLETATKMLTFQTPGYRCYKFPQFGFSIHVYD